MQQLGLTKLTEERELPKILLTLKDISYVADFL